MGRRRASGRRKPSAHLVGEDHLIRKASEVFRSHIQTASPSQVGKPRPRMVVRALIVIGKHDIQHVSSHALQSLVTPDITGTRLDG